jgi:hypothetical protein
MKRLIPMLLVLIAFNFYTANAMNALRSKQNEYAAVQEKASKIKKSESIIEAITEQKSQEQQTLETQIAVIQERAKTLKAIVDKANEEFRVPPPEVFKAFRELQEAQTELQRLKGQLKAIQSKK